MIGVYGIAQPNTSINLDKDKPKEYENRKLNSEKTGRKKFTIPRRLYNNMVTEFNYQFNANNRLNGVIEKAKESYKDDFTKLLSFYNYTLDDTKKNTIELDSVIYKLTCGLLLHDLRSDWVDDVYLLLGKAYHYRKDFDSAQIVFQYINYAFSPKDEGYDLPIGSNASNTDGIFTVATLEKRKLMKRLTSFPPRRNEAFIWMVRNYIEADQLSKASGLLNIIQNDPKFPERLRTDLNEMRAYLYYKEHTYDSAAIFIIKAIKNAGGSEEIARWYYLAGQLMQLNNKNSAAIPLFEKSIKATSDPYLEVYARLNIVKASTATAQGNAVQNNLAALYKLAKHDRYSSYRDIIYYATANLQFQQKDITATKKDLLKSIKTSVDNPEQKNKSWLMLADMTYNLKQYPDAKNYYDSIDLNQLKEADRNRVDNLKPILKILIKNQTIIQLQDSLLQLASLPEDKRIAIVKKIYRKLRKAQGEKEDANTIDYGNVNGSNSINSTSGLFPDQTAANSNTNTNEFYFNNSALKAQGQKDFKIKWGNRPNVDNWRRQAAINVNNITAPPSIPPAGPGNPDDLIPDNGTSPANPPAAIAEGETNDSLLTFEGLLLRIPMSQARKDSANKKVQRALLENGSAFQDYIEDYPSAIEQYEKLLYRYVDSSVERETALFNLIYCYKRLGMNFKRDSVTTALQTQYPKGSKVDMLNKGSIHVEQDAATKKYESIYTLFATGNVETAAAEKAKADSQYGNTYWTPQMLYIESMYFIKQKNDNLAILRLQHVADSFPTNPLAEKARNMISVLKRRKEIESYLTKLEIESPADSISKRIDLDSVNLITEPIVIKVNRFGSKSLVKDVVFPTINGLTKEIAPVSSNGYIYNNSDTNYVIMTLEKVDEVFVREARNAFARYNNGKTFDDKPIETVPYSLDKKKKLIVIGPFLNANEAVVYIDNTKPLARTRIVAWLTASKYNFYPISRGNLAILKANKDLDNYIDFIKKIFPDKF